MLCSAIPVSAADGPAELLQKGLFEEEANHNLESAIKSYQSVLQQTDEQRKLGATALFRLGECYRKLGRTNDALVQYRRLLREFPEQDKLATSSQQLVTELTGATTSKGELTSASTSPKSAEAEELARLQKLANESPDLVRAPEDSSTGQTRLHFAAKQGWVQVAEFLLAHGTDVNVRDKRYKTPLQVASNSGHNALVQYLLAHGADVNAHDGTGRNALHDATEQGYKAVVETLMSAKADLNAPTREGWTSLHFAALKGYRSIAEVLVQRKADPNARSTAQFYTLGKNIPAGVTPLFIAAGANMPSLVELLCQAGAQVNASDKDLATPLHYAATIAASEVIDVLLRFRADPNAKDMNESIPLLQIISSTTDKKPVVQLLKAGADPNAVGKDEARPLHKAAEYNRTQQLQALLEAKADPNVTNRFGMTPLLLACERGYQDVARLLLDNRANPDLPRPDGSTPLHVNVYNLYSANTAQYDYTASMEILKLLLAHSADVNARNDQGFAPLNFFGIPAKANRTFDEPVITLLKQHGAIDEISDLPPNSKVIRIWRQGLAAGRQMWSKPASGQNRFTLLETILNVYDRTPLSIGRLTQYVPRPIPNAAIDQARIIPGRPVRGYPHLNESSFDFPDFSRITIRRLVDGKTYRKIEVNLLTNGIIDCTKDMVLEFGDVVEIPERKHAIGAPSEASQLGADAMSGKGMLGEIGQCLKRTAKLVANGTTTELNLGAGARRYLSVVLDTPRVMQILPSTADFSRVKVTRKEQQTGKTDTSTSNELLFGDGKKPLSDDLLIEDGDIIEVPDISKP